MGISWAATVATPMQAHMWPDPVNAVNQSPFNGRHWVVPRYTPMRSFLQWNTLNHNAFWQTRGFLMRLRDEFTTVKVPFFDYRQQLGTWSGAKTVNGAHDADAHVLSVSGGSGTIAQGDHIMIAKLSVDTPRVYPVVVGGTTSITLGRGLVDALAGGETISYIGDGSTTVLLDNMRLVGGLPQALAFPSPEPKLHEPFAVEFISTIS